MEERREGSGTARASKAKNTQAQHARVERGAVGYSPPAAGAKSAPLKPYTVHICRHEQLPQLLWDFRRHSGGRSVEQLLPRVKDAPGQEGAKLRGLILQRRRAEISALVDPQCGRVREAAVRAPTSSRVPHKCGWDARRVYTQKSGGFSRDPTKLALV